MNVRSLLGSTDEAKDRRTAFRFWLALIAGAVFGVTNLGWVYLNWSDRIEMRHEEQLSQKMDAARARIEMIVIDSAKDDRPLTSAELQEIESLKPEAQYFITSTPQK